MSRARDTADQINRINSSAADATAITVDSSENVGIGTSSPTAYTGYSTIALNGTNGGVLEFKKGDTQMARITNAGDPVLQFATNNTERLRIDSDGLKFNGDTAAANALSDYEEGTFTVGFEGATVSAANTTATYTKIGDLVTWYWYSSSTSISSSSASGKITGLPFTVLVTNNNYNPVSISHNTYFGGSTSVGAQGYHLVGNNKVVFNTIGQANNPSFVNGNGISIMVHGSYKTAS